MIDTMGEIYMESLRLNSNELKQIKNIEVDLLKTFVNICQELNLNYFIIGGTLLGAVRHNGFITRDDVIDVGLPCEDYE